MEGTYGVVTTVAFETQPCKANDFDITKPIVNTQVVYNAGTVAPNGGNICGYWFTPNWFFGWNRY